MYGREVNKLNVYKNDSTNETVVWTKQGNQGNLWIYGQVNIDPTAGGSKLIFEATAGKGFLV